MEQCRAVAAMSGRAMGISRGSGECVSCVVVLCCCGVLDEAGWRVLGVVSEKNVMLLLARGLNRFQGVNWRQRLQVEVVGVGGNPRARGHSMQLKKVECCRWGKEEREMWAKE